MLPFLINTDLIAPVLLAALLIVCYHYLWLRSKRTFFRQHGIAHERPWPLVGHKAGVVLQTEALSDVLLRHYNRFSDKPFFGMFDYNQPVLCIRDPELIKSVTVRDFDHFVDRQPLFPRVHNEPLLDNTLVLMCGQRWRDMRATLTPAFTGNKVRQMVPLIADAAQQVVGALESQMRSRPGPEAGRPFIVEMKDLTERYATDVVASTAFGHEVRSFVDRENAVYEMGRKCKLNWCWRSRVRMAVLCMWPRISGWLGVRLIGREAEQFYGKLVHETIGERLRLNVRRPDMLQLLMEARKGRGLAATDEATVVDDAGLFVDAATAEMGAEDFGGGTIKRREWTDAEVTSQCYLFALTGLDTVSTLLSFLAYELMANRKVQEKLLEEVDAVRKELNGERITYEKLQGMRYMEQVVMETMRKWPVAGVKIDRQCTKPYPLRDADTGRILFTLPVGHSLWIPAYAIHHDPQYYPQPAVFDPERFSLERRHEIRPFTFLGLGSGPRNCIGSRFALSLLKMFVYELLGIFTIEVATVSEVPLRRLVSGECVLRAGNGIHVQLRLRKG